MYLSLALFSSLDVLHPSTSSANSTPSTNSSHPTQGRYQPFVYLLCAIQGALSLFFSLDVPSSYHTKCQFKPSNTRTIPYTPLSGISFLCSSGCFTKLRHSVLTHLHNAYRLFSSQSPQTHVTVL